MIFRITLGLAVVLTPLTVIAQSKAKKAAAPKAQKICMDAAGTLTARASCPKGSTQVTSKSLIGLLLPAVQVQAGEKGEKGDTGLPGEKGDKGDQGVPGISAFQVSLSADSDVQATIPAGSEITPPVPPIIVAGVLTKTATCSGNGVIVAVACKGGEGNSNITIDSAQSGDGKTLTCQWSNGTLQPINGIFFAKAVCIDV